MNLNFKPYSIILLYISIAFLLFMIVCTLLSLLKLKKAFDEKQPVLDDLKKQAELISIKTSAVAEKKAEDRKKNRVMNVMLPVLLAVYDRYRRNAEAHGVSGVFDSAKFIATNEKERNKLIGKVKKAL